MPRLAAAFAASLALGACSAAPRHDTPAAHLSADQTDAARGIDSDGYKPPPLDPARSITVKLHILSPADFDRAAIAHAGTEFAKGFVNRIGAGNECEIYVLATYFQASEWTTLGALLNHEADHCEGITHEQMH